MPELPSASTLLELIEAQARARGSSLALLAPDRPPLGYDALLRQVERVGASLAAMGLGRGQRIALALPNGPEMAVAILSAMSWSSCAPLNPASDEALCRFLLARMRAAALIIADGAQPPAAQAARALGVPILRLAFARDDPAGIFSLSADAAPAAVVAERARPDDLGLLLHTSGTTAPRCSSSRMRIAACASLRCSPPAASGATSGRRLPQDQALSARPVSIPTCS